MTVDTYGLSTDRYLEIFEEHARITLRTMRAMIRVALEEQVDLNGWPHDVVWKMYESITYDANDAARVIQKKESPDEILARSYDYDLAPTRQDLLEEIRAVQELFKTKE
jgi:hypothetical protein